MIEEKIRQWMLEQNYEDAFISKTIQIAWESQRSEVPETLDFMKNHVLNKNVCYLPETIPLCEEMNVYTNRFFDDLLEGI